MGRPRQPIKDRILRYVLTLPNGCWQWIGGFYPSAHGQGYGRLSIWLGDGKRQYRPAHVLSYLAHGGVIPPDHELDHLCRNTACVRPDHLEPVTHRENVRRGMSPTAVAHRTNVCVRGHPFTKETTYHKSDGTRRCKVCAHDLERKLGRVKTTWEQRRPYTRRS